MADNATFEAPDDRRATQRRRVLKKVTVARDEGGNRIACVMKNVSDRGALLEFSEGALPPATFVLTNELDGFTVPGELVWKDGHRYGIRFTGPWDTFAPTRTQELQPGLADGAGDGSDPDLGAKTPAQPANHPGRRTPFGRR